ncbi:MBL fold metallo-hydrolase [Paenibacillus sp. YIM B09110]|uniref:MBL fold metallo-hydrolase n=1 Tax=Paenibacillus sp. YIM B09110 TaxID=3126102 RepID=UPI00301E566B
MTLPNEGIKAIQLTMDANGTPFVVYPTLLWDDQDVILVDTGLHGQLELIRELLEQQSFPFNKLTKIIITHQDRDHIGSLSDLVQASEGAVQVLAHEDAVPYLAGEIPLIKSKIIVSSPVKVDVRLQDDDILPYAGGIQVIHTPGHTPDHISLYHMPSKTLIAGDALTSRDGVLQSFDLKFTLDHQLATKSVAKFQELAIDTVITYHGGVCTDHIADRLSEILEAGQ